MFFTFVWPNLFERFAEEAPEHHIHSNNTKAPAERSKYVPHSSIEKTQHDPWVRCGMGIMCPNLKKVSKKNTTMVNPTSKNCISHIMYLKNLDEYKNST